MTLRRRLHRFFWPGWAAEAVYWLLVVGVVLTALTVVVLLYRRATAAEAERDLACVQAYVLIYGRADQRLKVPTAAEACADINREDRRFVRVAK